MEIKLFWGGLFLPVVSLHSEKILSQLSRLSCVSVGNLDNVSGDLRVGIISVLAERPNSILQYENVEDYEHLLVVISSANASKSSKWN